ncbi:toxin-antitoxin system, toxin component, PIN family protein [Aureimonas sp. Leaf454]|nr:toxin-antitoxin system, toxin component, PIN family protein [Aureimonas sp. Leaf454]
MNDPILIDECLSPDLAALAQSRGYNSIHVLHRGRRGAKDPDLMPLIRAESFVFVTANGKDFLKLYARETLHPGLIIIVHGNGTAERQIELFALALDEIERNSDITNKLLEVFADGSVVIRDYPEDPGGSHA